MAGVGLVAAGGAAGALVPAVDELQPATSTAAAKAPTDARMTPSSGACEQALPPPRSPWHARLMPHGRRLLERVVFDHMIALVVQAAAANASQTVYADRARRSGMFYTLWHE